MTFLITIIASDLKNVPFIALVITSFLFLAFCGLDCIGLQYDMATVPFFLSALFSLVFLSFLFFFGLLYLGLLGFIPLFGFVGLTLWARVRFLNPFRLIVLGIEVHL